MTMQAKWFGFVSAAACSLLAACSGGLGSASPPSRYYVLSSVEAVAQPSSAQYREGPIIGVASVTVPEYLRNSGILTRDRTNEVVRAEFDQWAGPLSDEITRELSENLSVLLQTDRIVSASGRRAAALDFLVDVELARFERDPNGIIRLTALWSVWRDDGRVLVAMRKSRLSETPQGTGYGDVAVAMSSVLQNLSRDIAAAVQSEMNSSRSRQSAKK
jgi:uncharacterized protein